MLSPPGTFYIKKKVRENRFSWETAQGKISQDVQYTTSPCLNLNVDYEER